MKYFRLIVLNFFFVFSFNTYLFAYLSLNEAVRDSARIKEYSLSKEEIVSVDLGVLNGTQLMVHGNGFDVNGNSRIGMLIYGGRTLNIDTGIESNFTWKNFLNKTYEETEDNDKFYIKGAAFNNRGTGILELGSNVILDSNSVIWTLQEYENIYIYGGAIYNYGGSVLVKSTVTFSNNSAIIDVAAINAEAYGGAIYNGSKGNIQISSNCVFYNNSAYAHNESQHGYGGAIFNDINSTILIDTNVKFNSNKAYSDGGAIYNKGTLTIKDGASFINNISLNKGGAIFNNRILNLIANTRNIEFTGNKANGISNAIHIDNGVLNLWASRNADIIFNDRITSENNTNIYLNINSSTNTAIPRVGRVILNEDMSGYLGKVNLSAGEIKLQAKTEENSNININKLFGGNISLNSGTLNILNNSIDNVIVNTLSSGNLKIDVDLSNNTSDNFTVINGRCGILNLKSINILGVNEDSGQIILVNDGNTSGINVQTTTSYGGYEYIFTSSTTAGILNYEKGEELTFKKAINIETPIRSYSFAGNETVTEDLGDLGGGQLTIFGNGYDIDGNSKLGIKISANQTLNIEGVREVSNFNSKDQDSYLFLYNTDGSVNIGDNVIFSSNSATGYYYIGMIYNYKGDITIGSSVTFINNEVDGVISNEWGTVTIGTNAKFIDNYGKEATAIKNFEELSIGSNAIFMRNETKLGYGGAIYNVGELTVESNALFDSNKAYSDGGAIYNDRTLTIKDGAIFRNNKALLGYGGAILTDNLLNLIAETTDIEFTGNKHRSETGEEESNAIYAYGGTINLWASDKASIIFNDKIASDKEISRLNLNINQSSGTLPTTGKIILNEEMTGYTGQVYLYKGTIKLGEKGTLFGGDIFVDNATIDMANKIVQEHDFNRLTIDKTLNLVVDVDLRNKEMDKVSAKDTSQINGKINVKAINFLNDNNENEITEILFTTSTILKNKITSVKTASSGLYKYNVIYNDGYFNFLNTGKDVPEINPIILESQVSAAEGLITQTTVLNQAFSSIDNIRNRLAQAKQKGLLYASTADMLFENNNRIESGLWIRPFMSQDTINFDSLNVDNTLTGTLAGLDLAIGENSLLSLYLGYAGSNQKYEDIKINQTGYVVGATGMLIKEKWYAGITANVNFNKAESESDYGKDSFDMNMYSVGAKAGYNFNLSEKFVMEPNLTLMYGNVSNQEYETTQGANIDSQSTSAIIVEPQVKAKLNLTKGWQPYGLLGYVANISDKGKVVADGAEFETDKIDGYVEYGLGVNKDFVNTPWNCYLQVTGRSGGINGFSGNIGIKYSFGKKSEIKEQKKKEKEEKARLEAEEKARIAEEKRIAKEEQAKQKALEEERIRKEKEEKAKLEAEEKARIAEQKKLEMEKTRLEIEKTKLEMEMTKQKMLEEEKIRTEKERKEKEEQAKQKALEEKQKKIEMEARARLEAEEKARIAEEKRIAKEEQEKQIELEKERIRKEKEEMKRQKQLEIERKIQENYN